MTVRHQLVIINPNIRAMTKDMISFKGCTENGVKGESLYSGQKEVTPLQPR